MAALVRWDEHNTAGQTITTGITNTNWGSTDAANLVAGTYPITPGNASFEKWQKFLVTLNGSVSVYNFRCVQDSTTVTSAGAIGATLYGNQTSAVGSAGQVAYVTPVSTVSTRATVPFQTSSNAAYRITIAGTITATIPVAASTWGTTDFLVHQWRTDAGLTINGITGITLTLYYNEVL